MQVLVRDNNVDQALKALKKKMQREGIFREMKLRGHYEKPSEKRAREKAEAVRRARKLARKKLQREGLLPMKPKVDAGRAALRRLMGRAPTAGALRRRFDFATFFAHAFGERQGFEVRPMGGGRRVGGSCGMTARTRRAAIGRWMAAVGGGAGPRGLQRDSRFVHAADQRVAEVDADTSGANAGNIASLTDVIQRNPNDSIAYNTRGIAYAKGGQLSERDRRFHQGDSDRSEIRRRLHQSRARLSPDREGRPGARRFQRRHRRQPQRRVGLSRARQSVARARPFPRSARRPRRSDPAQPGGRAGLSRARADLSAPRQSRAGDHRFQQRDRPRSVRRSALSGARPELCSPPASTTPRSKTSTPRSTSIPTTPRRGRVSASPTRSRATRPRRSNPTSARCR